MNFDKIKSRNLIDQTFGNQIELCIAYGSAVFPQKGYDYEKNKNSLMTDYILVVEDVKDFHQENLKRNSSHYSGLSRIFGSSYLEFLQRNIVPIHYNPEIEIKGEKIKYGVIGLRSFLRDLNSWDTLIVAGRLQKPVKIIKSSDNPKILDSLQNNLISAAAMGLMFSFEESVHETQLFDTICSLSYLGDVRFSLGAESQNKIQNIVQGNYTNFQKLYHPILRQEPFKDICTLDQSNQTIYIDQSEKSQNTLINYIPQYLGTQFTGREKDFVTSFLQIKFSDVQKAMIETIKNKNKHYSKKMIFYNVLATSPIKNFHYAFNKLKKGLLKK